MSKATHPRSYLLCVSLVQPQPEISNSGIVGLEDLVGCHLSAVQVSLGLLQRHQLLLQLAHLILQALSLRVRLQTTVNSLRGKRKKAAKKRKLLPPTNFCTVVISAPIYWLFWL